MVLWKSTARGVAGASSVRRRAAKRDPNIEGIAAKTVPSSLRLRACSGFLVDFI